jgi:hypothetical protein
MQVINLDMVESAIESLLGLEPERTPPDPHQSDGLFV